MVFFISTGLAGVALALSLYILISLRGRKMSDLTKLGARTEDEVMEMEEKGEEKSRKTTEKSGKTDIDLDDAITYM